MSSLQTNNDELVASKEKMINDLNCEIDQTSRHIEALNKTIDDLSDQIADSDTVKSKKAKVLELESTLETRIRALKKEVSFFHDHDNCPTCKQGIDHDFKTERLNNRQTQLSEVEEALSKLGSKVEAINSRIEEITYVNTQITSLNNEITDCNGDIRSWNNSITTLRKEIETIQIGRAHV